MQWAGVEWTVLFRRLSPDLTGSAVYVGLNNPSLMQDTHFKNYSNIRI